MFQRSLITFAVITMAGLTFYSCSPSANEQTKACAQMVSQKMIAGYKEYEDSWTSMGGLNELEEMFENIKKLECAPGTDQKMLDLKYELGVTGARWIDNTTSVEFNFVKGFAAGYFGGVIGAITNTVNASSESDKATALRELHFVTINKFVHYMKERKIIE